jgi:PAS domain S-box-containing protein
MIGAVSDITERKRAEKALQESEARYKVLFTGAPEGIVVADLQTKQFSYANPAMCRMFGYTEEEFMRLGVEKIHPKAALDHIFAEFESQARGEKLMSPDLPCLRRDGTLFYANISGINIVLDDRKCSVGFFSDITEFKRMEEEKHRLEERSRKVVEDIFRFIPEGVLVFSRKMELLRQNQAFRELVSGYAGRLGFAEDELENLIIDKIKAGMVDKNIKEIRISRKHETGKQT